MSKYTKCLFLLSFVFLFTGKLSAQLQKGQLIDGTFDKEKAQLVPLVKIVILDKALKEIETNYEKSSTF